MSKDNVDKTYSYLRFIYHHMYAGYGVHLICFITSQYNNMEHTGMVHICHCNFDCYHCYGYVSFEYKPNC